MFSKSWDKTLLLILLSFSSGLFSSIIFGPVAEVHAQGGFDYTLSNSGGVTLTPGNPGSTTVIATLTGGTASNVTLACDLSNLPAGTSCSFSPASVIPTLRGNATTLTMMVPASTAYSAFNVTVNAQTGSVSPLAPTIFTLTVAAKIAVDPTATEMLNYIKQPITVSVNVTDSPPFGGFIVAIFYNRNILQFSGLQYAGNSYVFGSDVNNIYVSDECLDKLDVPGSTVPCIPDLRFDDVGVLSVVMATNGGTNTTTPTGILFSVTFEVIATGFSTIHIVHQEVNYQPNGFPLQSVGYDGYFTNEDCGGGNPCKPPTISVIPPVRPVALRPASFNSTAASQNRNGYIRAYNWTWGLGLAKQGYNSPGPKDLKPVSNVTIIFGNFGEFLVTLSVEDNYTARAYLTLSINVLRIWVDLGLEALNIDHTIGVVPGTTLHISATATNVGVNPENSTMRLLIQNQQVATQPILNLAPEDEVALSYAWNTGGLTPRVYRIEVDLDEVHNATTGQVLENDTSIVNGHPVDANNVKVAYVQLVSSIPGGFGLFLGLNLPETLGVGVLLVAVIAFGAGLVRKARTHPEPL